MCPGARLGRILGTKYGPIFLLLPDATNSSHAAMYSRSGMAMPTETPVRILWVVIQC